jgi:hypothetical protein
MLIIFAFAIELRHFFAPIAGFHITPIFASFHFQRFHAAEFRRFRFSADAADAAVPPRHDTPIIDAPS